MSKFHSTVTRRDFMKGLGLAGVGLGAAAAAAPVFHDLDEVMSQPTEMKRAWWIRDRDIGDPTVPVDFNIFKRYDKRQFKTGEFNQRSDATVSLLQEMYGTSDSTELWSQGAQNNWQGVTLRDTAVRNAMNATPRASFSFMPPTVDRSNRALKSNETYGMPKHQGTPEENLKMMQVAGRFFGAWNIGVTELDEKSRRFVWANDGKRTYNYANVDAPSDESNVRTIPNKYAYAFTYMIRHTWSMHTAPGNIGGASQAHAYFNNSHVGYRFQAFLNNLGYKGLGLSAAGSGSWPVWSGMGELSRGCLISLPEHGPMVRKMDFIITDFPMAPTKPIDAGMYKFCHTCAKCAEHCPTGSIPLESEPVFDTGLPWNNPGVKAWYNDYPVCNVFKSNFGPGYCGVCIACCPFTKQDVANVHGIVRAGMPTLPMLHGFTRAMDDVFGYGKNQGGLKFHESDNYASEWWNTIGPEYGLHTYDGI